MLIFILHQCVPFPSFLVSQPVSGCASSLACSALQVQLPWFLSPISALACLPASPVPDALTTCEMFLSKETAYSFLLIVFCLQNKLFHKSKFAGVFSLPRTPFPSSPGLILKRDRRSHLRQSHLPPPPPYPIGSLSLFPELVWLYPALVTLQKTIRLYLPPLLTVSFSGFT